MLASASLLCYNMFFDQTVHRGMMGSGGGPEDLVVEALNEDLYNPTIQTDDIWKKFTLPTPPYSPENYSMSCKRSAFQPRQHNALQVVPDDFPEDLSSDLPLVLSDAEMERLTSSTLVNDCMWTESDYELRRMPGNHCAQAQTCHSEAREILPTLPEKQLRDFAQFTQSLAAQENTVCQQQAPHRWMPYTVESPPQLPHCPRQTEDFAAQRFENGNSKRTRKPRRTSRNSPQRQEPETEDSSEDSEISRATHNVLERQRREDLKCRFQLLRDSIPELEDNERAPKVAILKKAREYVHQLIGEEERLCADKELERQRKLILLDRLQFLKNSCFGVL